MKKLPPDQTAIHSRFDRIDTMDTRPSPLAGKWYPDDAPTLSRLVDGYLDAANGDKTDQAMRGVVAPHAGLRFSGPVAGHSFHAVRGRRFDLVVVLGPSHYANQNPLLTCGHDAFETPLGQVPVDRAAVDQLDARLKQRIGFGLTPVRNDPEHSIEMELPFLQRALGKFSVLPVVLVDQSAKTCRALGEALAETLAEKDPLLVASSDLSHFYEQPVADRLDQEMLRRIGNFDPEAVLEAETSGIGYACGHGAIAATLWAAKAMGATLVEILEHATSGDVSGNYDSVVGYGAAAIR